jgi:hypothetical protein
MESEDGLNQDEYIMECLKCEWQFSGPDLWKFCPTCAGPLEVVQTFAEGKPV